MLNPFAFLFRHRQQILEICRETNFDPREAWSRLILKLPNIKQRMNFRYFENCVAYLPLIDKETEKHRKENKELKKKLKTYKTELPNLKEKLKKMSSENDLIKKQLYKTKIELNENLKSKWKDAGVDYIDELTILPPKNFRGWTVQYKKPYFRLYKKLNKKTISIHIGRYWNNNKALEKIDQKYKRLKLDNIKIT
jgi:hypothetical protein